MSFFGANVALEGAFDGDFATQVKVMDEMATGSSSVTLHHERAVLLTLQHLIGEASTAKAAPLSDAVHLAASRTTGTCGFIRRGDQELYMAQLGICTIDEHSCRIGLRKSSSSSSRCPLHFL